MTPAQQSLADTITRVLSADARLESAWLGGSLGKGAGDAYSDVDVTIVVPEPAFDAALKDYRSDLSAVAPVVLTFVHGFDRVVSAVTQGWQRFDLTFVKPAEFAAMPMGAVRPLFNRGTSERAPSPVVPYKATAQRVLQLTNEFLRVIGLTHLGIGRGEYIALQGGTQLLRQMTLDLMFEKNGASQGVRGSALHVNAYLTPDQRKALEAIPAVTATRESVLAAGEALAAIFLPLAKELATATGATWPAAFEAATRDHLARSIGLKI